MAITKLTSALVSAYDKVYSQDDDKTISVNPLVAELATWYEKLRTAMDYRADEVLLRSAIERILKRRLMMGGNGKSVAAPLIRELVWARYFPDSSIPESVVIKVEEEIDLYLQMEVEINNKQSLRSNDLKQRINKGLVSEWILQLLSCEIEDILEPGSKRELMNNFMYQIFRNKITIADDDEETKDVQVFIAVRRAFANDDLAFLRFHLFKQFYGKVTRDNLEKIADHFPEGIKMISSQFKYPAKDKIYSYIKNQTVPFLILDDVFRKNKGKAFSVVSNKEDLDKEVLSACSDRYKMIRNKVNRAIVRSVIFILFTKAIFAFFIEGTFEKLFYGKIIWSSIALNIASPVILMVIVGLLIKTPSRENSFRILRKIQYILFLGDQPTSKENPDLGKDLVVKKKPRKTDPIIWGAFVLLWLATFVLSFGFIVLVLSKLRINPLSQSIFMFFLAVVSFVSFRINKIAHMYQLKDKKETLSSLMFDFFFMPFISVGQRLTSAVSQLNIILFIFDFVIEAPFKGITAFFEQWLLFLRTQREKLD